MSLTARLISLLVLTTSIYSSSSVKEWERELLCGPVELGGFPDACLLFPYGFNAFGAPRLQSWV